MFHELKLKVSASETFGFNDMKLSFRPVGNRQGYLYKTTETDTFRRKSICFGIKRSVNIGNRGIIPYLFS